MAVTILSIIQVLIGAVLIVFVLVSPVSTPAWV